MIVVMATLLEPIMFPALMCYGFWMGVQLRLAFPAPMED
jgi:hypothetical protein